MLHRKPPLLKAKPNKPLPKKMSLLQVPRAPRTLSSSSSQHTMRRDSNNSTRVTAARRGRQVVFREPINHTSTRAIKVKSMRHNQIRLAVISLK